MIHHNYRSHSSQLPKVRSQTVLLWLDFDSSMCKPKIGILLSVVRSCHVNTGSNCQITVYLDKNRRFSFDHYYLAYRGDMQMDQMSALCSPKLFHAPSHPLNVSIHSFFETETIPYSKVEHNIPTLLVSFHCERLVIVVLTIPLLFVGRRFPFDDQSFSSFLD